MAEKVVWDFWPKWCGVFGKWSGISAAGKILFANLSVQRVTEYGLALVTVESYANGSNARATIAQQTFRGGSNPAGLFFYLGGFLHLGPSVRT